MLESDLILAPKPSTQLMVVLHGLGDSMEGYRWLPQMLGVDWMNYLLVNAPDRYYGGYSWYDYAGEPGPGVRRSRALLFELLDRLPAQGFPSENTVLFGFSQGCLMTLDVGLRYSQRLAALIGISGYAFEPETLVRELSPGAKQIPILLTHGTMDRMIPIAPVRDQVRTLQTAGLNIEWREFEKDHTIAGQEELAVIRAFVHRCFGENFRIL